MRQLAIDAGQSGVRARVLESEPLGADASPGSAGSSQARTREHDLAAHRGIRTDLPLADQLAEVVAEVADEAGHIDEVAVGSTGFTGDEDLTGLAVLAGDGVRTVLLAHDSTTSYLGALGAEQGVVVAAGTGVVTLAVGATAVARVDGWGNIMGDAGSGYWFGRAALDAAMRSYDGRGPATVLLDRLRAEFGDVEGAYIELQADPARIRRTASFSRWVTEAESAGDAVAAAICREGAAELAHSVASGLDRVGTAPDAPTPVCTIGGVFRSAAIATAFSDDLRARRPAVRILAPRGDGLDGAAALLTLAPASPLTARVTRITLP